MIPQTVSAYKMFFRDERQKLLESKQTEPFTMSAEVGKSKISFSEMARRVSASWKATTADEKMHYELLAREETQRVREENELRKQEEDAAKLLLSDLLPSTIDPIFFLPMTFDSIFGAEQTPVEPSPLVIQTKPALTKPKPKQKRRKHRRTVSNTLEGVQSLGKSRMEETFGVMPSLLGDIGDDAPWPV